MLEGVGDTDARGDRREEREGVFVGVVQGVAGVFVVERRVECDL